MMRTSTSLLLLALGAGVAGCADLEARRFYRDGTSAIDRGESELAIRDLEQAAALAPEISQIQNHLGIAYEDAGRNDDALLAYERAVALDCDNRAAEANLRDLRARLAREGRPGDLRPSPDGEPAGDLRPSPEGEQVGDLRSSPDGDVPNTGQGASR